MAIDMWYGAASIWMLDNTSIVSAITVVLCLITLKFACQKESIPDIKVSLQIEEEDKGNSMDLQDPQQPGWIQCFNPCTTGYLGRVQAMSNEQVEERIAKARGAQKSWEMTTFEERRRVLKIMLKFIVENQSDICLVAKTDSGKTNLDALLGEVLTTCEKIAYVCKHGEKALKREYRSTSLLTMHKNVYVDYLPVGVLAVIAPWNYPFHNVMNHVISGIFAGNAVVCKVSEYTSWSSHYFGQIISQSLKVAGHSSDLVQIITGFGDTGAALVSSPNVDKIIFTGSTEIGRKVMVSAAEHLTPVVLELGGKDPLVLVDDVRVEEVMPMAMRGVFQNCGQNCCGIERIYAYDAIHDQFVKAALEKVRNLSQGDDSTSVIDCGAMVTPQQLHKIQILIDDAVENGAKLLIGGKRNLVNKGLYFEPTILVHVTHSMRIMKEEVFGPVMTIVNVRDDAHLLTMINDCPFGLGSAVFSKNTERALAIGRSIRAGMTTINDFGTNYLAQSLPFGGTKLSGFGRFAGPEGLRACCLQKSVVEDKLSFFPTTIPQVLQYPICSHSMKFGMSLITLGYSDDIGTRIRAIFRLIKAASSSK